MIKDNFEIIAVGAPLRDSAHNLYQKSKVVYILDSIFNFKFFWIDKI